MSWYFKVLKNYVGFRGRATRTEYWMFVLFHVIISLILGYIGSLSDVLTFLPSLYALAILLPSLAVSVRRLHDIGKSGWWVLISLIPVIGSIILIVFYCLDSQEGENQHGVNPKMHAY